MRKLSAVLTKSGAFLLGSTILCTSGTALAQQNNTDDDRDIVVTASKREENLQDVPLAITAIGNERLQELQVKEFQDVVKFLPSVTIQTLAPGFSQVYFRGVASGENANHSTSLPTVGTYLDEMPITTIQGALDIHAYDFARVEALAGPQGTLYGASSMAGTIKLVTNRPDTSGTYGSVGLELNSVTRGGIGGVAEGFVNARLSDRAALRIVGWYRHDAGYIDNIAGTRVYPISQNTDTDGDGENDTVINLPGDDITQNNADLVEKDYNTVDTYGGRLALGIELDDDWTIRPTLMGQIQKANGSFAQERSSAVTRSLQTVQYNPERSDDKWIQAALTIEGKIGNWDLTVTGGHLRRKTLTDSDYSDYAYFYDALFGSAVYLYDNAGDQISPNQYIKGIDRYRRNFGEIRVASPADARIRFIGGLFYQRQSHNIEQHYIIDNLSDDLEVPTTVDNIWLTKQQRVDRDYAAFGELSFDITDKLTLTGGGRLYKFDNSLVGFFGYNNPGFSSNPVYACQGPAVVDGSPCTNLDKRTKKTDFIHKLNLTYKFTDDVMMYATWSRGFRPGGINRRGSLPPYGSDTLDNYELGWKTSFGPVRFNGAVYQEDWKNIQLSFLGANGLSEVRNAGIARIRGIEADVSYRSGGFSLGMGGSYNDATIRRDFCAIANADFDCTTPGNDLLAPSGSRLPVTAKFKGNAVARYEFPIGGMDGHVQFAVNHIGKRRSDLRTLENDIVGDFKAYTTADISVGVKGDAWSAELFATNLFDSRGVINSAVQCGETVCGDADGVTPGGGVFYDNVIRPRLIGIKVSKDF
ncbi:outer membrane receptor protein involved in Fe transport [Sphingopyxis sp. OAS728]|jgi:outer membrane receptor protein involved in Fe transport|uniref:TonB-dependent receptor n=1 Tax=Sphingopyxis sp. OAS728 TaxID=2663823 RepID=UPI00178A9484|nr:TonB-dependent receptor [Sphingopyxis sp. OAS728]MBE1528529.1 outer membrane receptor protein involved in Fe transport [Sphingopyxis sp. OAS728]